jgi:hypothetical protein
MTRDTAFRVPRSSARGRFSLETLIRFLERAGMHVELRVSRRSRASRMTAHTRPL